MSDKEHALASLGHSEVLSVQHAPGVPHPEARHCPDDGSHVPSSARRQEPRDVLSEKPGGTALSSETGELVEESGARSSQAFTLSSHAEILAGPASNESINWSDVSTSHLAHISELWNTWPVLLEHAVRVVVGLNLSDAAPPSALHREVDPA